MSVKEWLEKLRTVTRRRSRFAAAAATVLAVTGVCSGLTWASVVMTREDVDAKPLASRCVYTPTDRAKSADVPDADEVKAARPYVAALVTNHGLVTLEALSDSAPCAAASFSFLARKGYFEGSECHRVTTRGIHVLECGDPEGKGEADPGYSFPDENLAGARYLAGTVAMSKVVPGRNGSRFFFTYADPDVDMPPHWTPFAKVVRGLDVLKEIGRKGTLDGSTDGRPKEPVVIESVIVRQKGLPSPTGRG